MTIDVGDQAPDFTLLDQAGREVRLSGHRGNWVVLYFYPRDSTPGCTREACAFRDAKTALDRRGVVVLGVSVDDVASHRKFAAAEKLNFPILSDAGKSVSEAYGVWKEKTLYGRKSLGIERTTFLIDPAGMVRKVFRRVRVDGHVDKVIEALDALD